MVKSSKQVEKAVKASPVKSKKGAKQEAGKKEPKEKTKAPSAYIIFCTEKRPEIKTQNPEATFGEIGKKLGELWATLSDKQKQPYQDDSNARQAALPPSKKQLAKSEKPKKAPSAYILFCLENREKVKTQTPDITFGEIGKQLGQMWAQLSDKQKEPYHKEQKKRQEEIDAGK